MTTQKVILYNRKKQGKLLIMGFVILLFVGVMVYSVIQVDEVDKY